MLSASGLNVLDSTIDGTAAHYDTVNDVLTYDINISHNLHTKTKKISYKNSGNYKY